MERDQVLITRPLADAAATAALVAARGFVPVLAPLLHVRVLPLRAPPRFDALLLTSGNALGAAGPLAALARPLLAVGDATAERARAAGFNDVLSAGGDAVELIALVRRRCAPGARLLLVTGRGQGGKLVGGLRRAGFSVHRRVGYHARPVRRAPEPMLRAVGDGRLRAALFLSAETARTFARLLPPALRPALAETDALVIGKPAADALTPLPWRRVRVSVAPTLDQVLALL